MQNIPVKFICQFHLKVVIKPCLSIECKRGGANSSWISKEHSNTVALYSVYGIDFVHWPNIFYIYRLCLLWYATK